MNKKQKTKWAINYLMALEIAVDNKDLSDCDYKKLKKEFSDDLKKDNISFDVVKKRTATKILKNKKLFPS